MPQERKPPFDFKTVPTKHFMILKIKKSFFSGVKKGEGGEDDYAWYAWTFITPEGQEELAFTPEKLHQLFVSLGFKAGTEFGLKRTAIISETSDRSNISFAVRYNGQEYAIDDSNGAESLPEENLKDLEASARKIPANKKELFDQENDRNFEAWCEEKEKLYEWAMNMILDKEMDRLYKKYSTILESKEAQFKLELHLLEEAKTKINTLIMSHDKNGGKAR